MVQRSNSNGGGRQQGDAHDLAAAISDALRDAPFDVQHAGDLFLRADAERAIEAALGSLATIAVAGRDARLIPSASFMGARFSPDLIVTPASGRPVAVTLTLLRGDAAPVATTLANALVLSVDYAAVVAFVLDRRLPKHNPFGGPADEQTPQGLSPAERAFLEQLWQRHRVMVEVRRQDPFGWG